MSGPDLPPPGEPFTVDHYTHRWPMGAEKVELFDGWLRWAGDYDERGLAVARRTFPGHVVRLVEDNNLEVGPASPGLDER